MLSKLALLASAVSAGPSLTLTVTDTTLMTSSNFPIYDTKTANPTSQQLYGANGYACIRNGNTYNFPQATTGGAVVDGAGLRAFYTTQVAQIGTVTAAGNAAGDNSGCCPAATSTFANCSIGLLTGEAKITGKIAWGPGATGTQYDYWDINTDFLLAATYQNSLQSGATRSTEYCDEQLINLPITVNSVETNNKNVVTLTGFNGMTKCTYFINVVANKGAPAFKLTNAAFKKFQLHYVEWASSEMKFLPAASATPGYMGTYTANTFPMPLKSVYPIGATGANDLSYTYNGGKLNYVPSNFIPGSVGSMTYYTYPSSPFQLTQTQVIDTGYLFQQIAQANQEIATYNALLASYNSVKIQYEAAIAANKARVGDLNKVLFEQPVSVPNRPCAPTKPAAYTGPAIDWAAVAGATDVSNPSTNMKAKRMGWLARTAAGSSVNSGFVRVTNETATTAANTLLYAGHTFGLYGQGNDTMPWNGTAYEYASAKQATDVHAMMVSFFPYDGTDQTGLAADTNITMSAQIVSWRVNTELSVPSSLTNPVALTTDGAKTMLAGAVSAFAAVAITLF